MPFTRPSFTAIRDRVESGLASGLSLAGPVLSRSLVRVLSRTVAGSSHLQHGHIDHMVKQIFVKYADHDSLLAKSEESDLSLKPASFATRFVTINGVEDEEIPKGTIFTHGSLEFETQALATIVGGSASALVECTTAGAAGNVDVGQQMTITSPLPNINSVAVVASVGADGSDEEDIEAFRARYLEWLRGESLDGSDDDYVSWAKEVAGVTRAWVYRYENGLGTVVVRFVRDGDGEGGADAIPSAGEVAVVQAKLDAKKPSTAEVTAVAPSFVAQDFDITLPAELDTLANQAAIKAGLRTLYATAEPGDGKGRGTIYIAQVRATIGSVVRNFALVTPTGDFVPTLGQMAGLGETVWT